MCEREIVSRSGTRAEEDLTALVATAVSETLEAAENKSSRPSTESQDLSAPVATAVSETREAAENRSSRSSTESQDPTNPPESRSTRTADSEAQSTRAMQSATAVQNAGGSYAQCLDEVFLRANDDYNDYYWLSAAAWYCRHLQPTPLAPSNTTRCNLNQIEITEQRYPEWDELLHYWHAVAVCDPRPTTDATHIGRGSSISPTPYGSCLDNAFLSYRENLGDSELVAGVSAWLCQDHLPTPPDTHRLRCDLNRLAEAEELYPEWPEDIRQWHAIMHCLPDWQLHTDIGEDIYSTCLGDVYAQVNENYDKDAAISAAVWRCKNHMPKPPEIYNPRCEINQLRREGNDQDQWPAELTGWNAIVQCYPSYKP